MTEKTVELKASNFAAFIAEGTVLIDFYAPWCGPCRMQAPILDNLAGEFPAVKIGKLNIDEAHDLAAQYGVSSIPYLVIFKDGVKQKDFIGLQQQATLSGALKAVG